MTFGHVPSSADAAQSIMAISGPNRTVASYECELAELRSREIRLCEDLSREEALLRQKNELIHQNDLLRKESDHRLLNELQIVVSLLSMQSRASADVNVVSQLTIAANRVATIGRIHKRLHGFSGEQTIAFKNYLEDFCRDFVLMLSSGDPADQVIVVEGVEIALPNATAAPLSFIVNEMITNAVKYGKGRITVRLESNSGKRCALSVCNDGAVLPEGFDPAASNGQGMKIIRSFVQQIGGELQIGRSDQNQGARFTVLFS
jgi:two-component sensor histidine kinase